jgi:hypothetical protein
LAINVDSSRCRNLRRDQDRPMRIDVDPIDASAISNDHEGVYVRCAVGGEMMKRAFSRWGSVTHLSRRTIACVVFIRTLASGMTVPETTFAKDNPPVQPILCESNDEKRETADCLQRFKELATREGDVLRLNLQNGKTKDFAAAVDVCDPYKCTAYHLAAFYPSLQSFLVEIIIPECSAYELINLQSGSSLKLSTAPEISPDGKYLVSIDQDELCERAYDLAIWSTSADPPVLELKHKAEAGDMNIGRLQAGPVTIVSS